MALGPILAKVKKEKAAAGRDLNRITIGWRGDTVDGKEMNLATRKYPNHSIISPKKFAPETYSNIPPEKELIITSK